MAIEDDIEDQVQTPKRTRTDEASVEERPIQEMIDADRYLKAGNATKVPWGMKMARVQPGGTT